MTKTSRLLLFLFVFSGITSAQQRTPVLDFPHPVLDDPETYRGYLTRFFRDPSGNTAQISIDQESGRVVILRANAANESIGFTARDRENNPVALTWAQPHAMVGLRDGLSFVRHSLQSQATEISLGLILLGTMRREREFQYSSSHLLPFETYQSFVPREIGDFLDVLAFVPEVHRKTLLDLLSAASLKELEVRPYPTVYLTNDRIRVVQHSFDAKNRLVLEVSSADAAISWNTARRTIDIRSRSQKPLTLTVASGTDASPLVPVGREELFTDEFLEFLTESSPANPRLERQVRSLELLSSREKLMAGLPNFATYFGRDMIMSMLMLEPVLKAKAQEDAILAILKKLSDRGEVSHEESLGGQAVRENLRDVVRLLKQGVTSASSDSMLSSVNDAIAILSHLQKTREDYRMLDDDFQLPVLIARYLTRKDVSTELKRRFLRKSIAGTSVKELIFRNLGYVVEQSAEYAQNPVPAHLVDFPSRVPGRWFAGSWRDSDAGYANGRYAMDINAIWVPEALEATQNILEVLRDHGFTEGSSPEDPILLRDLADPAGLEHAIRTWRGAIDHFKVEMSPGEARKRLGLWLESLPPEERRYWQNRAASIPDPFRFLALALDSAGRPIPVPHTDGATLLFLRNLGDDELFDLIVTPTILHYPVGLFVHNLGPLCVSDSYAPKEIWEEFRNDRYHSPYVVWGREVNLLLLGLWNQRLPTGAITKPARDAWQMISDAADASGLKHNELWTYAIRNMRLIPTRYQTGSDIQAWNTTDLTMQFLLWKQQR